MYFIKTWIGPNYINNQPAIYDGPNGENFGQAADEWIRQQFITLGIGQRNALFNIELWNVTQRIEAGLSRTNNSVEVSI